MVCGTIPGLSDVTAYPFFCNLPDDDVHLSAGSPLLALGACGLVGALGQGCTETVGAPDAGRAITPGLMVTPNPGRGGVRFAWSNASKPEALEVFDVTGSRRWSAPIVEGASGLQWPAIDREGRRLPAGVYYARLMGKGTSATARFVLVE
jgi:hypothetical protein